MSSLPKGRSGDTIMKQPFAVGLLGTLLALSLAPAAAAQTKTIPGETTTITATVEAIDTSTRTLTLKGPKGNYVDVVVPPEAERFSAITVGDSITARCSENIVRRVKRPGEAAVDTDKTDVTRASGSKPGATAANQRTMTVTITAIDQAVPSITFTGPNNWTYSSRVEDKKALATVKVGDKVDITWTAALLVSFEGLK